MSIIKSGPVPLFVGDSGAGGTPGLVPGPPAGAGAAGWILAATGGWVAPPVPLVPPTNWTPTITVNVGTISSAVQNAVPFWAQIGPLVFFALDYQITISSAAGFINFTLPSAFVTNVAALMHGSANLSIPCVAYLNSSGLSGSAVTVASNAVVHSSELFQPATSYRIMSSGLYLLA